MLDTVLCLIMHDAWHGSLHQFLNWNEEQRCCCPLVQAWPACTPWSWWCRPGSGIFVTRERVRPRRKEKRRRASIWSCEFCLLQSFVQPVRLWCRYSSSAWFVFVASCISVFTTSSSWWSPCCSAFLSWLSSTIRYAQRNLRWMYLCHSK